jgi:hypothetical protein
MLSHDVYFMLKNRTPEARENLVQSCHKYLAGHPGVVFYAAGTLNETLRREVNDLDFDVTLQLVFVDKAAHDIYQAHPKHLQFIEENKPTWGKVRVFDADIQGA